MGKSNERGYYVEDEDWGTIFHLHDSTVTIINPNDEDMLSCKKCSQKE